MSLAARTALVLIRAYKVTLSPLFAGSCRYTPGCADYMSESIARFGVVRGGWLGTKRLCRCHPFGGHGFDPVPTDVNHPSTLRAKAPASLGAGRGHRGHGASSPTHGT